MGTWPLDIPDIAGIATPGFSTQCRGGQRLTWPITIKLQLSASLFQLKMTKVHDVAESGFAKGTNELVSLFHGENSSMRGVAEIIQYDRVRPSYPPQSLHQLYNLFPEEVHDRGLRILEPGAGTGIFTRLLLAPPSSEYPTWNIDTLIGIEPSEGMREAWNKGLERLPPTPGTGSAGDKVKIVEGTFDNFSKVEGSGVKEGSVDLVVIAQAWHWCPDHEAAFVSYHQTGKRIPVY